MSNLQEHYHLILDALDIVCKAGLFTICPHHTTNSRVSLTDVSRTKMLVLGVSEQF